MNLKITHCALFIVVHEAKLLMLDISKARYELGWKPQLNIEQTVALTLDWYIKYKKQDVYSLIINHIENFVKSNNK